MQPDGIVRGATPAAGGGFTGQHLQQQLTQLQQMVQQQNRQLMGMGGGFAAPPLAPAGFPVGRGSSKAARKAAAAAAVQQHSRSHSHTQQAGDGCFRMLVARVALGRQAAGTAGMRRPPEGFHSVFGLPNYGAGTGPPRADRCYCHVIFQFDQGRCVVATSWLLLGGVAHASVFHAACCCFSLPAPAALQRIQPT
jgi:hypothetical protein